jgi:hypothetical protein
MTAPITEKRERLSQQEVERQLDEAKKLIQESRRSLKHLEEKTGIRISHQRPPRLQHAG